MIKVRGLTVSPLKVDRVLVKWAFVPTHDSFADYELTLERSLAPHEGYTTVYRFVDDTQYADRLHYRRLWQQLYYRVRSRNTNTNEVWVSDPVKIQYSPNLEAIEIIRRNDLLLRNKRHGIGVPVVIFLRKHEGVRCECWDTEKSRPRKSNCDDCFQTGFYNGYYAPVYTWANPNPAQRSNPRPQWGETETNDTRMFLSNYPELHAKDLILNSSLMQLWEVDSVDPTFRRGHLLHQLVTVSYVDRNHVFYKLLEKYPGIPDEVAKLVNRIKNS